MTSAGKIEAGARACGTMSLGVRSEENIEQSQTKHRNNFYSDRLHTRKGLHNVPISCRSMSMLVNGEQPLVVGSGPLRSERLVRLTSDKISSEPAKFPVLPKSATPPHSSL